MLLHDKLKGYRLLLASQSPRRRELMTGSGLDYELAQKYDCDEVYPAGMPAEEVPAYLARLKNEAYPAALAEREILMTADTVVIIDGKVVGKPRDRADAARMLRTLSGRRHTVITAVTLRMGAARGQEQDIRTFTARSSVWMRPLRDEEIDYYLDNFRPYDKAGSYGIQEWIGYAAIERINGSFYNVMGLPIQRVYTELEKIIP